VVVGSVHASPCLTSSTDSGHPPLPPLATQVQLSETFDLRYLYKGMGNVL
jgi:hypothetical protein